MNKTEILTEVGALLGRTGYTVRIGDVLDLGLDVISQEHDFRVMVQAPSDVAVDVTTEDYCTAAIPAGYLRLISASLVRGTQVTPIEIRTSHWVEVFYPRMGSSRWVGAEVPGGLLLIKPDPAAGDKVRFIVSKPLEWAVDGEVSTCPAGIEQALIAFATSWMFESLEIPDSAERWRGRYGLALQAAITSDTRGAVVHRPGIYREVSALDDLLGEGPDYIGE